MKDKERKDKESKGKQRKGKDRKGMQRKRKEKTTQREGAPQVEMEDNWRLKEIKTLLRWTEAAEGPTSKPRHSA